MDQEYFLKNVGMGWEVVVGTTIVITMLLFFTRIFGLKSFSKMSGFDFVNTLMIGNLAGMTINTGQPKLLIGIFIIFLVYLSNYVLTKLRYTSNIFESIITNKPILLMRNGEMIEDNMKKAGVTVDEIRGKLREANVLRLSQAKAVILETTGDVSVLHEEGEDAHIDDFLLEGIKL